MVDCRHRSTVTLEVSLVVKQVFSPVAKLLTLASKSFHRLPVRETSVVVTSTYSLFHEVLLERRRWVMDLAYSRFYKRHEVSRRV